MTKKQFLELLNDYPDNANIYFNDDANLRAMTLTDIQYVNDDFAPDLSPDKLCPKIFIHLNQSKKITMARTRLLTKQQLERKYSDCLKSERVSDWYDFLLRAHDMSCTPAETFKSWYLEMKIQDRKDFCLWLINNKEQTTVLKLAIKYL